MHVHYKIYRLTLCTCHCFIAFASNCLIDFFWLTTACLWSIRCAKKQTATKNPVLKHKKDYCAQLSKYLTTHYSSWKLIFKYKEWKLICCYSLIWQLAYVDKYKLMFNYLMLFTWPAWFSLLTLWCLSRVTLHFILWSSLGSGYHLGKNQHTVALRGIIQHSSEYA